MQSISMQPKEVATIQNPAGDQVLPELTTFFQELQANVTQTADHVNLWFQDVWRSLTPSTSSVTTNLIEQKPEWLPLTAISKIGTLSTHNFLLLLLEALNVSDKNEKMLWHFSQRKFPPTSPFCDAVFKVQNSILNTTEDGFATSFSPYAPHEAVIVPDQHIFKIHSCSKVAYLSSEYNQTVVMGVYDDGKVIFQQMAQQSCTATSAAMLIADRGLACDVDAILNSGNELYGAKMKERFWTVGLKLEETRISNFSQIPDLIAKYGSVACGISPESGGHCVVLDSYDREKITMRDPFHGWRIDFATPYFHTIFKAVNTIQYVI